MSEANRSVSVPAISLCRTPYSWTEDGFVCLITMAMLQFITEDDKSDKSLKLL